MIIRSRKKIIPPIIFIIMFLASSAHAWLIYSKPEFRGRIIDVETKEPIEGVVVVVVYKDHTIVGGPGGGGTSVIKAKETLTDKKGEFYFPAYTTLMGPNSKEDYVNFIIFKPGYMAGYAPTPGLYLSEHFFSSGTIGKEGVVHDDTILNGKTWKGQLGIVEMKKAKTYDDRRMADLSTPDDYTSKELPLLFKAIRDDRKERGLEVR